MKKIMYFAATLLLLAGCQSSQNAPDYSYNGHDYVDLGLPSGIKWATCNVGATKPEKYGDYFAWGETTTKSDYFWSTYFDSHDGITFTMYYKEAGGKTKLDPEDDAATVNWGSAWRMPTIAELEELKNNCEWEWCDGTNKKYNNTTVKGYIVKSKVSGNSNSIFLPAAGYFYSTSHGYAGSCGFYWSASLSTGNSIGAHYLDFRSGVHVNDNYRCCGQSVRPVCQ